MAPPLVLRHGDRERLTDLARRPSVPSGLAKRARLLLLAAEGMPNAQIARELGVSRPTVIGWRDRYAQGGIKALEDEPRSGRPPRIDEADVVVASLASGGRPPPRLGATQWSARLLAKELGISFASVARVWRRWGIRPGHIETFRFGTVPELEPGIHDVVGLHLGAPDNAIVVSVAEVFQVRTAHRATLGRRRMPEWRTRGHRRHGAATLLAALQAGRSGAPTRPGSPGTGSSCGSSPGPPPPTGAWNCMSWRTDIAWPGIPRCAAGWPRPENRRVTVHVAPAGCPWLTLVQIFFGILAEQGIQRGGSGPGAELSAAISGFTQDYSNRHQAFTWIKNATELPG